MRKILLSTICILCFIGTFLSFFLTNRQYRREAQEEMTSGKNESIEALEFWTKSRAYPDNDIPPDKYYKAFQLAKMKVNQLPQIYTAGSVWDPIGPLNLQGRTLCVAVNPLNSNTIFVGTASGGLWRSYTAGSQGDWQQVKLGYPALGISSIIIDPTDSNTIYIGTGEVYGYQTSNGGLTLRTMRGSYGIGILKTVDGGSTWTKSLDWSYNQQRGIEMLKFNPLNRHTIWAATTEGLYRSVDDGINWVMIKPIILAEDMIINPTDTTKIVASFGDLNSPGTGLYKSINNGINWNPIVGVPTYTGKTLLAMYVSNPSMIYASIADSTTGVGSLWQSTDFGDSWVKLSDYVSYPIFQVQGWYSHYVAVHPTNSNIIVHNSVLLSKSIDGGATFNYVSSGYADNHGYTIDPHNPNILYAANDDGIYRSTDFGSSYVNIGYGIQSGQFYNGFSCSSSDSSIAIGQSQDHIPGYRYLGTMNWDHGSVTDEVGWTAINPQNDNIMYAINRFGETFFRSLDRGASFQAVWGFNNVEGIGSWNSPIGLAPSNPQVIYFGDTTVYKSINGGSNWYKPSVGRNFDGNPTLPMAVAPTSQDTVYIGTAPVHTRSHIYRTANGGTSWTDITGIIPNRYPMDLMVDPSNAQVVYLAMGGFGTGHVFKSTNAGSAWTDITGSLPDVPTSAIAIDPIHSSNVYVGNDLGVYVSTTGGGSWSSFSEGLPDAVIAADLTISPANRALRIATHGNGVWERRLLGEMPANYFDYKTSVLIYPTNGLMDTVGAIYTPIRASFRNLSANAQSDSFNVEYRILSNTTEVYSNIKRISGLGLGETRQITFDGSFVPPDTGTYTLQAISLALDQNSTNDTLAGSLTIIAAPTIRNFRVNKLYSAYTEISGGSPGPYGDDVQMRIGLPFSIKYDGFLYDSVQISTNGWMELGTGTPGSLHGLSTQQQLGGYFLAALGTTDHPTKALGPWWTDLSTFNGGVITYTTQGVTPNRIFIAQWKNMPSYFDPNQTSITINFQVKLYETTNVIEYCYGPMVPGGNPAVPEGASIGLKDDIGGDYRYYDIARHASGLSGDLRANLSPLTDWPGPDSIYQITTNFTSPTVSVRTGWNLVSIPVYRYDHTPASIFSMYVSGTAFEYNKGYSRIDSLKYGEGYWIKSSGAASFQINGASLQNTVIPVTAGWNLIGSVDHEIAAPFGGIVSSFVFGYSNTGYNKTSILTPGEGYWVKASGNGSIVLGPRAEPKSSTLLDNANCAVTISDRLQRSRTLYLTETPDNNLDMALYELPPIPPKDVFDARFVSQRMIELYPKDLQSITTYPIYIQSAVYPLQITGNIPSTGGRTITIEELSGNNVVRSQNLTSTGMVLVYNGENIIRLKISGVQEIPTQFALKQNYPNPFNPATTISFDIPVRSTVNLVIYDILGKEVKTITHKEYDAGSYSIAVDFSNFASGVYMYRISTEKYTEMKKMLLLR
ncbi:MAG: T9SS type A sorting domain-containing protein [Bacteroidota bacterium]